MMPLMSPQKNLFIGSTPQKYDDIGELFFCFFGFHYLLVYAAVCHSVTNVERSTHYTSHYLCWTNESSRDETRRDTVLVPSQWKTSAIGCRADTGHWRPYQSPIRGSLFFLAANNINTPIRASRDKIQLETRLLPKVMPLESTTNRIVLVPLLFIGAT